MSFAAVRPYINTLIKNAGFKQWKDAFNQDNIPSTLLDNAFHLESGSRSPGVVGQKTFEFEYPLVLRIFKKGYRDTNELIDNSDVTIDSIVDVLLAKSNNTETIKSIEIVSIDTVQLGPTNDNALIIEFNLNVIIYKCFT